jgi:hypothetical protein
VAACVYCDVSVIYSAHLASPHIIAKPDLCLPPHAVHVCPICRCTAVWICAWRRDPTPTTGASPPMRRSCAWPSMRSSRCPALSRSCPLCSARPPRPPPARPCRPPWRPQRLRRVRAFNNAPCPHLWLSSSCDPRLSLPLVTCPMSSRSWQQFLLQTRAWGMPMATSYPLLNGCLMV